MLFGTKLFKYMKYFPFKKKNILFVKMAKLIMLQSRNPIFNEVLVGCMYWFKQKRHISGPITDFTIIWEFLSCFVFGLILKYVLMVLLIAFMVIGVYGVVKYGCDSFNDHQIFELMVKYDCWL